MTNQEQLVEDLRWKRSRNAAGTSKATPKTSTPLA
jgi:hypothetical protein